MGGSCKRVSGKGAVILFRAHTEEGRTTQLCGVLNKCRRVGQEAGRCEGWPLGYLCLRREIGFDRWVKEGSEGRGGGGLRKEGIISACFLSGDEKFRDILAF